MHRLVAVVSLAALAAFAGCSEDAKTVDLESSTVTDEAPNYPTLPVRASVSAEQTAGENAHPIIGIEAANLVRTKGAYRADQEESPDSGALVAPRAVPEL